jgi:hypothetical protein
VNGSCKAEPRAVQGVFVTGNSSTSNEQQLRIVRDDTGMTTTYANRVEVAAKREAISLLFGVEQACRADDEIGVQLSKCVVLDPAVAKRLAIALKKAIGKAQAVRGTPPDAAKRAAPSDESGDPSAAAKRLGKVLDLFRQLRELDTEVDFEHSFKIVHGQLSVDRFLLGVNRLAMAGRDDERIVSLCEKIGMPSALLAPFMRALPDANHVYFGVERDDETLIFKTYLENRDRIEREIADAPVSGQSFPLFTGFKWDVFSPDRQAVTQYAWFPSMPVADIVGRLQSTIGLERHGELFGIARGVVERAAEKIPGRHIQYLEVAEEGNPRRSFDINIYKSGLRLQDLEPYMSAAQRHFALPAERFGALLQRIKGERFGHLAGGIDRKNKPFMTVYYGVQRFHSDQLGAAMPA